MKKTILLLLWLISTISFGQIKFEPGYFIDDKGKVECLIKNTDWRYNPTEFEYKLSETDETKRATIQQVKEFGIDGQAKFIRVEADIDYSSDIAAEFTTDPKPRFKKETVFLRTLVEGKVSLYQYLAPNLKRYFVKKESEEIEALVYKRYKTQSVKIGVNNQYIQQLNRILNCEKVKPQLVNTTYSRKSLMKVVENYNSCEDGTSVTFHKENKGKIQLNAMAGLNSTSYEVPLSNHAIHQIISGTNSSPTFGLEVEYIMPSNKNKWGFFAGVQYYQLKIDESIETPTLSGGVLIKKMDNQALAIPAGARYYFFLSDNSKLFLEAFYLRRFNLNDTKLEAFRKDGSLLNTMGVENALGTFGLGAGYKFADRYAVSAKYVLNDKTMSDYLIKNSFVQLTFSYSIFK